MRLHLVLLMAVVVAACGDDSEDRRSPQARAVQVGDTEATGGASEARRPAGAEPEASTPAGQERGRAGGAEQSRLRAERPDLSPPSTGGGVDGEDGFVPICDGLVLCFGASGYDECVKDAREAEPCVSSRCANELRICARLMQNPQSDNCGVFNDCLQDVFSGSCRTEIQDCGFF